MSTPGTRPDPAATDTPTPAGDYAIARLTRDLVFVAGITPKQGRTLLARGRLGQEIAVDEGRRLAGIATHRALTAARTTAQEAGRTLRGVPALTVYIATTADFTDLSEVADGASAAVAEIFGPSELPARVAVGVATLPGGAPVEVQLVGTMHRI